MKHWRFEDLQRLAKYYFDQADSVVDEGDETTWPEWRFILLLQRAGLPVATRAVAGYFTWEDRHLYSAELQAWSAEHKRQRAR